MEQLDLENQSYSAPVTEDYFSVDNWPINRANPQRTGLCNYNVVTSESPSIELVTESSDLKNIVTTKSGAYISGTHSVSKYKFLSKSKEWEFKTSSAIKSPPILANGLVYIPTFENLIAISMRSGKKRWEMDYGTIDFSPIITERYLIVENSLPGISVFDAIKGELLWKKETETSPFGGAVSGQELFLTRSGTNNGRVCRLNLAVGKEIWCKNVPSQIWTNPVVAGSYVLVGARNGRVYCYDMTTGEEIWTRSVITNFDGILSDISITNDSVFVGSNSSSTAYCLDIETGIIKWSYNQGISYISPVCDRSGVFFAAENEVHYHDSSDGEIKWSQTFPTNLTYLALTNTTLYVVGQDAVFDVSFN